MSTVSPTGTGRWKSIWSMLAVTHSLWAWRAAESAPAMSIHFITLPPWTVSWLFAWFGCTRYLFSMKVSRRSVIPESRRGEIRKLSSTRRLSAAGTRRRHQQAERDADEGDRQDQPQEVEPRENREPDERRRYDDRQERPGAARRVP
jgi:hypothetical protein